MMHDTCTASVDLLVDDLISLVRSVGRRMKKDHGDFSF